jgi:glycosyltransferase involved in cell wall biosynthesis
MRIIHFSLGKANPNRMNGVGVSIHNIACAQSELGHEVSFWGVSTAPNIHDYPERPYKTELFSQPRMPFSLPISVVTRLKEIPKDTVFHLHGGLLPILWSLAKMLKKQGFRYLYTPHGAFMPGSFERGRSRKLVYMRLFEKQLMQQAEAVMVSGKGEKDFILHYFPAMRVKIIPNGYELLTSIAALQQKPTLQNHPVFCYCGRINRHHKGLDILVDGFATYRKQGGKGHLILIGGGPDLDFLKNRVLDHELASVIEFTGPLFDQAKQARIREGDVFVHTSRMEGFPSAVLEAAALGLPLLVSEATNMGDYVRTWQSGWVLTHNDATNVANSLLNIEKHWNENKLLTFAERSLQMIEGAFLRKKIAAEVVKLY